jgi:hypothetical protein
MFSSLSNFFSAAWDAATGPSVDIDGSPMVGSVDIHGNPYGVIDISHGDNWSSCACDTSASSWSSNDAFNTRE